MRRNLSWRERGLFGILSATLSRALSVASIGVLLLGLGAKFPIMAAEGTRFAAPTPDPVKDCPIGLVCFTVSEAAKIDRKLIQYERDLTLGRKQRRFGMTLGGGCGLGGMLDENYDTRIVPNCGAYLVWGIRF